METLKSPVKHDKSTQEPKVKQNQTSDKESLQRRDRGGKTAYSRSEPKEFVHEKDNTMPVGSWRKSSTVSTGTGTDK